MLKRWGARRVVILVISLALLLCCGGTLVWYAVDTGLRQSGALPTYTPSPTDTPRPTATIRPTRTARPTVTERPTATERPPTNTPPPATSTDEPTNTPLPTATVETSYTDSVLPILGNYSDALNTLSELFSNAGTDASLIATDAWRIKVATQLAMIKISGDDIRALTPPATYATVHAELLDAASHLDSMTQLSAQGIDNLDVDKLRKAVDEMGQGNEAIKRALAAMPTADGTSEAAVQATQVPQRAAPTVAIAPVAATGGDHGFTCDKCIKGNINSDGKKLYHLPICPSYDATKIDSTKGERMFSSEAEAQAAGWSKANNCP